jgi:hypothetical protein
MAPESFRGGCSFGAFIVADAKTKGSPAGIDRLPPKSASRRDLELDVALAGLANGVKLKAMSSRDF